MQIKTGSVVGDHKISDEVARHRSLMTDAGSFIWDLEVHKAVACHTGYIANAFFTAVHALESFWHGEGIRTFFRGTVISERCHLRGSSRDIPTAMRTNIGAAVTTSPGCNLLPAT